ncbi:fumarate reductase/succinate dehydrogenase flavoprotein subunit [Candidatus Halobeggiatoa sp. HSG11]|nr:fumarate reductase/succinate dehydrogenase flavoprotein subunit [Candidatus Halobeggiatoa sp. HSG11]
MKLEPKIPDGPIANKWTKHKFNLGLINPANKRKYDIIVVGTGLAGASAAATLAELGYNVKSFCFQDSPRRAHSVAAQGGINAAKNYQDDGDSIYRLFYDTIKGGDFRAREAGVYRLAEVSGNIIDQCVAQGVPFAREYGGLLSNRSFGGAQVSRTFYAKGQTGQQLLIGAYGALSRQIWNGKIKMYPRTEMLELVIVDGKAQGIVVRDLVTGKIESHSAHAVILATGGYGNVFFLSTNNMGGNVTASWQAHKKGALFANPSFVQTHPTCLPMYEKHQSKLTLMSESLRNDARVWVPKNPEDTRHPNEIPEAERDYILEQRYPSFGNLVPRDVASRCIKQVCDEGRGVGKTKLAVYLDFKDAIVRQGRDEIENKYGNIFHMYEKITDQNAYERPMQIYPAVHYTMGGLWVDYNLMTTVPGLFALGECNFSDHGANRLGASGLMQALADGYFVISHTIADYLVNSDKISTDHPAFKQAEQSVKDRINKIFAIKGEKTVDEFHKELGLIMWHNCGMSRNEADLKSAKKQIKKLEAEFWQNLKMVGTNEEFNQTLEKALRVADFLEMTQLMVTDALHRDESCGSHFREEHQTEDNEAKRDDENFTHVAAWQYQGKGKEELLHKEELTFAEVKPTNRSYK